MTDLFILRALFVAALSLVGWVLRPFGLPAPAAAAAAGGGAALIVLFETRIRQVTLKRLIGGVAGGVVGIGGAFLISLLVSRALPESRETVPFLEIAILLLMTYCGLMVGGHKGEMLNLGAFGEVFGGETPTRQGFKILDTSVIIDGRIAEITETGFLDGTLVVPQFVLRELQLVADSSDSMKRNRGRRGLDILQRIQKNPNLEVRIVEEDFPNVRDVDMKLIELAKRYRCKIVTNDFNLNKVAQLQGVEVLNINELANAMRPVVLPGELMKVFILKEGKEFNQGVAYLDDGTMVVVDNAKKLISK